MAEHEEDKTKITDYLKEVGVHLRDVDTDDRRVLLTGLNARIQADVRGRAPSNGQDVSVVEEVLDDYGTPAKQAAQLRDDSATGGDGGILAWEDRVWLGVCSGIARRIGIDANFVRLVFVVLGFVPPLLPFLIAAYLGFFGVVYVASPKGTLPRLRLFPIVRRTVAAALAGAGIYGGAYALLLVLSKMSKQVLGAGLLYGGQWNWLLTQNQPIFFWVMVYTMPIAIMSAMPVKSSWAGTLEKVVKAAFALYAMIICIGLAFIITGLLVDGADQFTDSPGTDAIYQLFQ
jgi:phage shock protein PspC (stress-responsive transcriptional regulator)